MSVGFGHRQWHKHVFFRGVSVTKVELMNGGDFGNWGLLSCLLNLFAIESDGHILVFRIWLWFLTYSQVWVKVAFYYVSLMGHLQLVLSRPLGRFSIAQLCFIDFPFLLCLYVLFWDGFVVTRLICFYSSALISK